MNPELTLDSLKLQLRKFAEERDWGQFHSPKNIAMALTVEAAELQEIFQWLTTVQSESLSTQDLARAAAEIADVFLYTIQLADRLDIDLLSAAQAKINTNAAKYPVEISRSSARKSSDLQGPTDRET